MKYYHGNDQKFLSACSKATHAGKPLVGNQGVYKEPTQRQYRKWLQQRGAAWQAR